MKACLYSGDLERPGFRERFPEMTPGDLPFAGKSICRHMVDLCGKLNVSEVLLADRYFNPELAGHLGDGSYWSLRLKYITCERRTTLNSLLKLWKEFSGGDDEILIFWGMVLPNVRDEKEILQDLREIDPDRDESEGGVFLFREGKFYECSCLVYRCDSLKAYFDINFRLLREPGVYSLPGYSLQAGFGIGRNVAMMPDCDVQTPVIILDDVYLRSGVTLKNGAIIGQYVVIDEGTEIDHTIVMNNTYIGGRMQFRDKIVYGNRVFDPETDTFVDLDDDFLAADLPMPESRQLFMPLEWIAALFLAVFELPPYLLALLGGRLLKNVPFFRFLYEIYPKFWKVLVGRAQLVRFGSRQKAYVFRMSDTWWPAAKSEHEKNMADVYYYYHRNLFLMIAVVVVSQLRRLLSIREPVPGDGENPGGPPTA